MHRQRTALEISLGELLLNQLVPSQRLVLVTPGHPLGGKRDVGQVDEALLLGLDLVRKSGGLRGPDQGGEKSAGVGNVCQLMVGDKLARQLQ